MNSKLVTRLTCLSKATTKVYFRDGCKVKSSLWKRTTCLLSLRIVMFSMMDAGIGGLSRLPSLKLTPRKIMSGDAPKSKICLKLTCTTSKPG